MAKEMAQVQMSASKFEEGGALSVLRLAEVERP